MPRQTIKCARCGKRRKKSEKCVYMGNGQYEHVAQDIWTDEDEIQAIEREAMQEMLGDDAAYFEVAGITDIGNK